MTKHTAEEVAAAILLKSYYEGSPEMHYKNISEEVLNSGLSDLAMRGGRTPAQTLNSSLKKNETLFVTGGGGFKSLNDPKGNIEVFRKSIRAFSDYLKSKKLPYENYIRQTSTLCVIKSLENRQSIGKKIPCVFGEGERVSFKIPDTDIKDPSGYFNFCLSWACLDRKYLVGIYEIPNKIFNNGKEGCNIVLDFERINMHECDTHWLYTLKIQGTNRIFHIAYEY